MDGVEETEQKKTAAFWPESCGEAASSYSPDTSSSGQVEASCWARFVPFFLERGGMGSACAEWTRGEVNRTWSVGVRRRAQGDGTRGRQKTICQRHRSTRNVHWQPAGRARGHAAGARASGSGSDTGISEGSFAIISGDKSEKESDRKPPPFHETNYLPTILPLNISRAIQRLAMELPVG